MNFFTRWLELYSIIQSALERYDTRSLGTRRPEESAPASRQGTSFPTPPCFISSLRNDIHQSWTGAQTKTVGANICITPHDESHLVLRHYCESLVEECISSFEEQEDETVEEFLLQLSQMFLGCTECIGHCFAVERVDATPRLRDSGSDTAARPPATGSPDITYESTGVPTICCRRNGIAGCRSSDKLDATSSPAIMPIENEAHGTGILGDVGTARAGVSPGIDVMTHQCLQFMRARLETAILRRAARNPVVGTKLAWLLEDIAVSKNSTLPVRERSDRANFLCKSLLGAGSAASARHGAGAFEADGNPTPSPNDAFPRTKKWMGKGTGEIASGVLWEERCTAKRRFVGEQAAFVEGLVSIAFELGSVKQVYNLSRDVLVPEAKSRLDWMNRRLAFRLAAAGGWVSAPTTRHHWSAPRQHISPVSIICEVGDGSLKSTQREDSYAVNAGADDGSLISDIPSRAEAMETAARSTVGGWGGYLEQGAAPFLARSCDGSVASDQTTTLMHFGLPFLVTPSNACALRVLRCLPEETLVLNSASRAPFMVVMELIEDPWICAADAAAREPFFYGKRQKGNRQKGGDDGNTRPEDLCGSRLWFDLNDELTETWFDHFVRRLSPGTLLTYKSYLEHLEAMDLLRLIRGAWGELWSEKKERRRAESPYGDMKGWRLASFIVKAQDDIRREQLAMQFIKLLEQVWQAEGVDVYLRPYHIICCGAECGMLENIANGRSLDSIKKSSHSAAASLVSFFEDLFRTPMLFHRAQQNFMRSLVPYSILTYLFQIKDRHNGNVLIDAHGHCLHIDFGYMLGESPGGDLRWEKAPFKLSGDFCDILDGVGSPLWHEFEELMIDAFRGLQTHVQEIIDFVAVSAPAEFTRNCLHEVLQQRIMIPESRVRALIRESAENEHTLTYDVIQRQQNGIL